MWTVEDCHSYKFIQLKNGPVFCKLENFPTNLDSVYETYYVLLTQEDNNIPALFPYAQRRYHLQSTLGDTPLRCLYCPWKDLIESFKRLEEKWEIKGKIVLSFSPEHEEIPKEKRFSKISYHLTPSSYGYIASVEEWANLRKPSDFPVTSDWLYKSTYLTFQHKYYPKRIFFPYGVEGKVLNINQDGRKKWKLLIDEKCEYLKPRLLYQLEKDSWHHNGHFHVDFFGVDSFDTEKNIVQFLFENTHTRIEKECGS